MSVPAIIVSDMADQMIDEYFAPRGENELPVEYQTGGKLGTNWGQTGGKLMAD